jgi:hypothetical protein
MNKQASRYASVTICSLASLLFSGIVAATVSVYITPDGDFSVTPGVAVVDQSIATITLNADENYQVTLRDNSNGVLKNNNIPLPYTVKYDNGYEITLSTNTIAVETGASVTNGSRSLTVFIGAAATVGLPAGAYSTTITVEILAN